ncbi:hypothetical protein LTR62_008856 [Meristemomyces frigidus]|uniref:Apple domain-containing protein n=1 Tax=Meristemomyces frigidus TaxID=1508187 RepID=A0AAN7T9G7_9PEZI|nr:hypothetical protein LTR62_008856 [Meristemomyces frigidus]
MFSSSRLLAAFAPLAFGFSPSQYVSSNGTIWAATGSGTAISAANSSNATATTSAAAVPACTTAPPFTSTFTETEQSTSSLESTSTLYTGTFTFSTPRTACPTQQTTYTAIYPAGTTTSYTTDTTYTYAPSYYPTVYTVYTFTTKTAYATLTLFGGVTTVPTLTYTESTHCSATTYTATASTTATQSAKCAPTNLYLGVNGIEQFNDGFAERDDVPGAYDASSCCQLCQDDGNCAASSWYGSCSLYYTNSTGPVCGQVFNLAEQPGGGVGFGIQTGCGIVEVANYD